MSDSPVNLHTSGVPETRIDPVPPKQSDALAEALAVQGPDRRTAIAAVVSRWPTYLEAWARLGDEGRDTIERYAAYRVGYHRGLDTLRASGWRGSGYVRHAHEGNRGFLDCLGGLAVQAAEIGEAAEAQRCAEFLHQLDPNQYDAPGSSARS